MEVLIRYIECGRDTCVGFGACERSAKFISYILHNKLHLKNMPTQMEVDSILYKIIYSENGEIEGYISGINSWSKHYLLLESVSGDFTDDFANMIIDKINIYLSKYGYLRVDISDNNDWMNVNHAFVLYQEDKTYIIDAYVGKQDLSIRIFDIKVLKSFISNKFNIDEWNKMFNVNMSSDEFSTLLIEFAL